MVSTIRLTSVRHSKYIFVSKTSQSNILLPTCLIICRKKSMEYIFKQLNKSLASNDVILDS